MIKTSLLKITLSQYFSIFLYQKHCKFELLNNSCIFKYKFFLSFLSFTSPSMDKFNLLNCFIKHSSSKICMEKCFNHGLNTVTVRVESSWACSGGCCTRATGHRPAKENLTQFINIPSLKTIHFFLPHRHFILSFECRAVLGDTYFSLLFSGQTTLCTTQPIPITEYCNR